MWETKRANKIIMEFIGGLIVLTIRIALLAALYALVTMVLVHVFFRKKTWWVKIMESKVLIWFVIGFVYTALLFVHAFSFWGYSGLGDSYRIPIGSGFVVKSIDAMDNSWFEPDHGEFSRQADIRNFSIRNETICGEFGGFNSFNCGTCLIVFNTKTGKISEFHSPEAYAHFATKNNLPQAAEFKDFSSNYSEHRGLLKWLFLP
jgi:hypothetical protein